MGSAAHFRTAKVELVKGRQRAETHPSSTEMFTLVGDREASGQSAIVVPPSVSLTVPLADHRRGAPPAPADSTDVLCPRPRLDMVRECEVVRGSRRTARRWRRWMTSLVAVSVVVLWSADCAAASTWSLTTVPLQAGMVGAGLSGVSCTATSVCEAVGASYASSGEQFPLAEGWDGTGWSVQSTPAFSHGLVNGLLGVSCVSAAWCMAVGSYLPVGSSVALDARGGLEWVGVGDRALALPRGRRSERRARQRVVRVGECVHGRRRLRRWVFAGRVGGVVGRVVVVGGVGARAGGYFARAVVRGVLHGGGCVHGGRGRGGLGGRGAVGGGVGRGGVVDRVASRAERREREQPPSGIVLGGERVHGWRARDRERRPWRSGGVGWVVVVDRADP